ncbi:ParM/StbA family protein, partial [Viridibacillus arvi]|uniref:ParM/StbA family protein n=1 Tax=Viridibacillus arvi TaxID=263475 RepID=UPI0034CEE763
ATKQLKLESFFIDDVEYVWGEDISKLESSVIKQASGHDGRYKSEPYKIMAKIAMAKVVNDLDIQPTDKIYLVTGVPSQETRTERENEIELAFYGENGGIHEVDVVNEDGATERMFRIAHVDVMSQPVATVIGRYLDEEGYIGDEDYEDMKVGVIDIGGGTTDLDIVSRLQRLEDCRKSIPKGFSDVYKPIRNVIKEEYPSHDVSDYELLDCLKEKKYKPSRRAEEVDFKSAMESGIREVVVDIQQAILNSWKDQTGMDEILLIGASAKEFEADLSNVVSGVTIPENHSVSNVEGYFRWGMNKIGDDEE